MSEIDNEMRRLDKKSNVFALIGNPVKYSLSPIIHNKLFYKHDIKATYITLEVEDLERSIQDMRMLDIKGFNVTMPYKDGIAKYLDEVAEGGEKIGSLNTVVNEDGEFIGHNTDGFGAREALRRFTDIEGKDILILGAGGAAKAIVYELSKYGEVTVLNRTVEKAKKLERLGAEGKELNEHNLEREMRGSDILINATSVGMNEEESLVPSGFLRSRLTVFDIVYHPIETKLLRDAREKGCLVIDGLWMLIYQGLKSFKIWTGIRADPDYMRKVALRRLKDV